VPQRRNTGHQAPPEFHNSGHNLANRFLDQNLFTVHQRDDGVRVLFHELDEVRVHREAGVVQSSQLDHGMECGRIAIRQNRSLPFNVSAAEMAGLNQVTDAGLPKFDRLPEGQLKTTACQPM